MKTYVPEDRIFLSDNTLNQPLQKCQNGLSESSLRSLLFSRSLSLLRQLIQRLHRSATHGCLVGKAIIGEAWTNNRVFAGVVLLLVAPCFWWVHLFFDWSTVVPGWYYKNWFFWFFTNREELTFGMGLTGFFLVCPRKWGYRYLLTPVVSLCFSEIIYQSFQIDNWKDFYNPMWSSERGWELGLFILFVVYAIWRAIDYAVYRKYHLKDGNMARIKGIIMAPGISDEKKMNILERLIDEQENFNARV